MVKKTDQSVHFYYFCFMKTESKVRKRILETTGQLFYRQGYQSTGINQIIAESGVAKASFYSHFPTKENLCATYLKLESDAWLTILKRITLDKKNIDNKLDALFNHLIEFHAEHRFRGCAFLNIRAEVGNSSPKITQEILTHKTRLLNFFHSLIPNEKKAKHIYVLYEAALMECQVFAANWPAEEAREFALEIIKLDH